MTPQTERLGVARLQTYFATAGWLFREQFTHDYGIDAQVEIVEGEYPSGKIIAIQIKSGDSFISEETSTDYIFRTKDKHINYWKNHTLPVILVLYSPTLDKLFWQSISSETVINTGKDWKIPVPKINVLKVGDDSLGKLGQLAQPEPYIRKLNKLRLDKQWMQKIQDGDDVVVQYDKWVNKSLPRYQLRIICDDATHQWPFVYGPGMTAADALANYIPWAEFAMDMSAHRESATSDWEANCYSGRDIETGAVYFSESFDEWYEEPDGVHPIHSDGEIETYSLVLSLNELGKSFLEVSNYLSDYDEFEYKTFAIE